VAVNEDPQTGQANVPTPALFSTSPGVITMLAPSQAPYPPYPASAPYPTQPANPPYPAQPASPPYPPYPPFPPYPPTVVMAGGGCCGCGGQAPGSQAVGAPVAATGAASNQGTVGQTAGGQTTSQGSSTTQSGGFNLGSLLGGVPGDVGNVIDGLGSFLGL
jgi:hypothetical protein